MAEYNYLANMVDVPEDYLNHENKTHSSNFTAVHNGKFIKRLYSPKAAATEAVVSKMFKDTETPGHIPVHIGRLQDRIFSVAEHKPNAKTLAEHTGEIPNPGNVLLSELLVGAIDRHHNNYMIDGNNLHSIDHESSLQGGPDKHRISDLYARKPDAVADVEHLNRWKNYGDKFAELVEKLHGDQTADDAVESYKEIIQRAEQSAAKHGHVKISDVVPQEWNEVSKLAAYKAPMGGAIVNNQFYDGGSFMPKVLKKIRDVRKRIAKLARTDAQSSVLMVSPSTREQSIKALPSSSRMQLLKRWVGKLAPDAVHTAGTGYWKDGQEESLVVHGIPTDKIEKTAARLGSRFNQKGVIYFTPDNAGKGFYHTVEATPEELDKRGVEYKTSTGSTQHILDEDGSLHSKIKDLNPVSVRGHVNFIGGDDRNKAAEAYNRILSKNAAADRYKGESKSLQKIKLADGTDLRISSAATPVNSGAIPGGKTLVFSRDNRFGNTGEGHGKEVFTHVVQHVKHLLDGAIPSVEFDTNARLWPSKAKLYDYFTANVHRLHPDYVGVALKLDDKQTSDGKRKYVLVHKDHIDKLPEHTVLSPPVSKNVRAKDVVPNVSMIGSAALTDRQISNIERTHGLEDHEKLKRTVSADGKVSASTEDISKFLDAIHNKKASKDTVLQKLRDPHVEGTEKLAHVINHITDETGHARRKSGNSSDWYGKDIDELDAALTKTHNLTPAQLTLSKAILAFTSKDQKPIPNLMTAHRIIEDAKKQHPEQPFHHLRPFNYDRYDKWVAEEKAKHNGKDIEHVGSPEQAYEWYKLHGSKDGGYMTAPVIVDKATDKPLGRKSGVSLIPFNGVTKQQLMDGIKGKTVKIIQYAPKVGEDGRTVPKAWGPAQSIAGHIEILKSLVHNLGEEGAAKFLTTHHPTDKPLKAFKKTVDRGDLERGEPISGAYLFGPKFGPFFENLFKNHDKLTADKWWSRTWNRYLGTLHDAVNGEQTTPRNNHERKQMRMAVEAAAKNLKMAPAEVQATLWYYEQHLWRLLGANNESQSFADAAKHLLSTRSAGKTGK